MCIDFGYVDSGSGTGVQRGAIISLGMATNLLHGAGTGLDMGFNSGLDLWCTVGLALS